MSPDSPMDSTVAAPIPGVSAAGVDPPCRGDSPAAPVRPPWAGRRTLRVAIALTLVVSMLLLVTAAPAAAAARASVRYVHGIPLPGGSVVLEGRGFTPGSVLQARWDSSRTRIRLIWVDSRGRFAATIRISRLATLGTHRISLARVTRSAITRYGGVRSTRLIPAKASLRVAVIVRDPSVAASAPAPVPAPAPAPAPVSVGTAYGSVQGDTRNNHVIGGSERARLSFRFRATTTSSATSLKVQQRGGSGYSAGDGGTIRASIQTDSGGLPSGTALGSLSFSPGNPSGNWETWPERTFPTPVPLVKGTLYHIVFENTSAAQTSNYISLNDLYLFNGADPRQPVVGDDFAVYEAEPSPWVYRAKDTPIFDLAYANGVHDGMSYIGAMIDKYVIISGPANMARERFTVSGGDRTVTTAAVRVRRTSGSSPLTIRLETGDGTLIEEGTVAASSIPASAPGGDNGGAVWATVVFASPHALANGSTYHLRVSTAPDTQYTTFPVQEGTPKGLLSYRFTDGTGQRTTDGSSWADIYGRSPADLQFYLR